MEGIPPLQRGHNYEWPRQPPALSRAHWTLWKQALYKCFLGYITSDRLRQPLTTWLVDPTDKWEWSICIGQNKLFHKQPHHWEEYTITRGGTRQGSIFKLSGEITTTLPPGHRPADVTSQGLRAHHIKLNTKSKHAIHIDPARPPPTTLAEALPRESEHSHSAVKKLEQFPVLMYLMY